MEKSAAAAAAISTANNDTKSVDATKKSTKIDEQEISPNEYFKLRSAAINDLKQSTPENHPYPHKFHVSTSLEAFIEKFSHLQDGETLNDVNLR